jgi:hypothetical protein
VINSSLSTVLRRIDYSNWKWQPVGVVWVAALRARGEERINATWIYRQAQLKVFCHGIGLQFIQFYVNKFVLVCRSRK